jgi:cellulose biosynthesis protein BcsQ
MPAIMFWNLKGGVGKTVTSLAVGQALAATGCRVMVVDADPQRALSWMLLGDKRVCQLAHDGLTLADYLSQFVINTGPVRSLAEFAQPSEAGVAGGRLSVVCSSANFGVLTESLDRHKKDHGAAALGDRVREAVRKTQAGFKTTDWVLVDCPPSQEFQVSFLLSCTDGYVTPCVPDLLSVRATLNTVQSAGKRKARPLGTLWNLYRGTAPIHKRMIEAARNSHPLLVGLPRPFDVVLPNASALVTGLESGSAGKTLSQKYGSALAGQLRLLAEELKARVDALP